MEQESLEAHNMQLEYMRENMHLFSDEDVNMLQLALQSNHGQQQHQSSREEGDDSFASENGASDEEGEQPGANGEEEEGWSYEQLLSLGQALGGNIFVFKLNNLVHCISY